MTVTSEDPAAGGSIRSPSRAGTSAARRSPDRPTPSAGLQRLPSASAAALQASAAAPPRASDNPASAGPSQARAGHRDGLDLRWLLDQLIVRTVGIDMAVLLSADGLLLSRSSGMGLEPAEHLAATASALTGLARSAGRRSSTAAWCTRPPSRWTAATCSSPPRDRAPPSAADRPRPGSRHDRLRDAAPRASCWRPPRGGAAIARSLESDGRAMFENEFTGRDVDEPWFDDDAGPLVRAFAVTSGRTRPSRFLDMVTLVMTVAPTVAAPSPEHRAILRLCAAPRSVAEVASTLASPSSPPRSSSATWSSSAEWSSRPRSRVTTPASTTSWRGGEGGGERGGRGESRVRREEEKTRGRDPLPVRHAGPGAVLVHLGRARHRGAGRGRPRRHPQARPLLRVDRLLRAPRHPVRRRRQLLRRRAGLRRRRHPPGAVRPRGHPGAALRRPRARVLQGGAARAARARPRPDAGRGHAPET